MTSRVKPENFDRCIDALSEGGYDFFLTYAHPAVNIPLDPAGYPHLVVGHDSLVAVARPGWPQEWQTDGMPMLQYSRGSFLNKMAHIALAPARRAPRLCRPYRRILDGRGDEKHGRRRSRRRLAAAPAGRGRDRLGPA